jgi:hypothetical protein
MKNYTLYHYLGEPAVNELRFATDRPWTLGSRRSKLANCTAADLRRAADKIEHEIEQAAQRSRALADIADKVAADANKVAADAKQLRALADAMDAATAPETL